MSKKRKREVTDIDPGIVQLWDQLADNDESIRLDAAQQLVSKALDPRNATKERLKVTLTRLFRGLCSSRKSARLGFSIALTELLSQLNTPAAPGTDKLFEPAEVVEVLEHQTAVEGGTTGQEERDHYLGKVFGADAIIKSEILFAASEATAWTHLLAYVCGIAHKKPWLRQESGWILYNCVGALAKRSQTNSTSQARAVQIVQSLAENQLVRTPEGVAIWLRVEELFPDSQLPVNLWNHKHPLARKDVTILAKVMNDARPQRADDADRGPQGSAGWSPQLHFAWTVILQHLYDVQPSSEREQQRKGKRLVDFELFWKTAVEDGLLGPSSSPERKHWGHLLLSKVVTDVSKHEFKHVLQRNIIRSLITTLKGEDKYLERSARKAVKALEVRLRADGSVRAVCLEHVLQHSDYVDFDKLTKSNILNLCLSPDDQKMGLSVFDTLLLLLSESNAQNPHEMSRRYRVILDILQRLFGVHIVQHSQSEVQNADCSPVKTTVCLMILELLVGRLYFERRPSLQSPEMHQTARDLIRPRLAACLEQTLKYGNAGKQLLRQAGLTIAQLSDDSATDPDLQQVAIFDPSIQDVVLAAVRRLHQLSCSYEPNGTGISTSGNVNGEAHGRSSKKNSRQQAIAKMQAEGISEVSDGLAMLYSVALMQAYDSDTEAVEILQDLMAFHDRYNEGKKTESASQDDDSEILVEILLSFASRPAKLMRRLSLGIFESLTSTMSERSLEALCRVLETDESAKGQEEMFEAQSDDEDGAIDGAEDSDVETVDSDVETASEAGESDSDPHAHSSPESEDASEDAGVDEEVAEFEAKLAAALGTRKGQDDLNASDTSGSSDSDMDDDQMMALDDKLANVFKARRDVTSKKKDDKDAKENIINFKNRVLDFIDRYLRRESTNPLTLQLLLPLLQLARRTSTKQLATRSCSVVRDFCSRCKGNNVPVLDQTTTATGTLNSETLLLLKPIHDEAGHPDSNAHAAACSAASILVVKSLVHSSPRPGAIDDVVAVYAETRVKQLTDKNFRVQPAFFTDWNNWCAQARDRLAS